MSPSQIFLGIDVSTTNVKALLINEDGSILASTAVEHPISNPKPLWSEQNPDDWWEGAAATIRQALEQAKINGSQVAAVGLTGQMHGLVLLDQTGRVLRPAILWNDQRTAAECEEIEHRVGSQRLLEITGNHALTGFTAPKILWVRGHEPEVFARIAHILLPKDYIRFRLTGDYAVDKADGSGMLLFDLKARDWSDEILNALEIPRGWLPETVEGPQVTGGISAEAARLTGLQKGTPVVGGGGDQPAQAVGVGAVKPGIIALTLGTSGVIFAPTAAPFIEQEGRLHAFCHSVPESWCLMGVMLSAAGSLRWFRDAFAPALPYDKLLGPASLVPAGCEGLIFLPYLSGERTPHPDPLARGAFIGMTLRHGQPHLTRAVLEGVAFGLRDSMELVRSAGLDEIYQVRVSGGGAKSRLWRQILADVIGSELVTVNAVEGAAYGAALLAGVGTGHWKNVQEACDSTIRTMESTEPGVREVSIYNEIYPRYRELYPVLKPVFHSTS